MRDDNTVGGVVIDSSAADAIEVDALSTDPSFWHLSLVTYPLNHKRDRRRAPRHNGGVLFARVVATSALVAATRSRKAKIEALSSVLRECAPSEIAIVVGFLVGEPRDRKSVV